MNKLMRFLVITLLIILALTVFYFLQMDKVNGLESENELLKNCVAELQTTTTMLDRPYTMIVNGSSFMYLNKVSIDESKAIGWTDVNGISGFDVCYEGMHIRYVEGHVSTADLSLYAPYLIYEEDYETLN